MALFISTSKFERWWRKAQAWFATQFASINIDTTTLAKDATVAKESTLGTTADSGVATTIFGWLKAIWDKLVGIVTTYPYAKEATLTNATNGLAAIKTAVDNVSVPAAMAEAVAQAVSDIDDAVDDAASDIEAAATGASGTIGTAATNAAASISNALSQYLEEKDISIQQTIGFTDVINACEEIAAAIWPEMANYPTPYTAADFDASGNLIE